MPLNKRSELGRQLTHIEVDSNWTQIESWLAAKAPMNHTHSIANVTGLQIALDARVLNSQKGVANGVATLGSDGKVPSSQLPNIAGNGMYFPQDTLTGADIGKLVIWKDGKAQLPVFEAAVPAGAATYEYELTLASFAPLTRPTVTISFTDNPTDLDTIGDYTFVVGAPASPTEVQIQGALYDTISRFIIAVVFREGGDSINRESANVVTITSRIDGITSDFEYTDELLANYVDTSFCTVTRSGTTATARLGSCLVPFLFLRAIGYLIGDKYANYVSYYSTSAENFNIFQIKEIGGVLAAYPSNISELKAGILSIILADEFTESASWTDDVLSISTHKELPLELSIDTEDEEYWTDAFADGEITVEATPATPSYCKYPILGLVKSVAATQVEIYTEPVCEFKSVHEGVVSWDGLLSFNRMFVLNPDAPGYLMPFITLVESDYNIVSVLAIAAGGYINAIENDIETNIPFLGAFSLDIFAVKLIVDLFLSGE